LSKQQTKGQNSIWDADPLIVIASNRGPYAFSEKENGDFEPKRGAGGLVTALWALAERHDVLWVASALSEDDRKWSQSNNGQPTKIENIDLLLIESPEDRYDAFYNSISNPLLWFIQHEMWNIPRTPSLTEEMWQAWEDGYVWINQQFADAIAEIVADEPEDRPVIIMPQDYHLYLVPEFLRPQISSNYQIQPFVHIPWPGPNGWRILPEPIRNRVLRSMLSSNRIGFQTKRDAFNFVQTSRFYLDGAHSYGSRNSIEFQGRKIYATAYPISIDVEKVDEIAEEPATTLQKNQLMSIIGDNKVILRTDRVEPSKNILRGLEAYRDLLTRYPEHRGNVQFIQLLVPSRMGVEEYSTYLKDIMAAAGMINADFSEEFWEPVRTIVGNNYSRALAAMQIYDVLLVNPIADGMNLVAKEGVLVNNRDGVLVLSENAGAFYELGDYALNVSPFDTYSTANAIHEALTMSGDDKASRAEKMRQQVRSNDVRKWFANQVEDALNAFLSQSSSEATSATPSASTSE
jgi:trehalose 6-phosphate synthase